MDREGSSTTIKSSDDGKEEEYDVLVEKMHEDMQNNVILHGEKHVTVARNMTAIGDHYLAKQSYLAAREYYEKALNLLIELFGNANEETIDAHYRLANLVALQTEGSDSRETRTLNTKIRSLREQFDQVLGGNQEVKPTLLGEGTPMTVSHEHRTNITKENSIDSTLVYSDIADEARINGDYEEAQRMYLKALELRRKKYGPKSAALTPVLLSYGEMLRLDGNLRKAKNVFQEALDINLETYGKHSEYVAEVYNNLGQLYKQLGDLNEADTVLLEALRIRRLNFGEYHPAIGSTLNNLAEIARERLDFITSLSYHATAVEAFEKSVGVEHVGYMNAKGNLGLTLRRQAQIGLEKGEQLVKNTVEYLALKKYDSRHPWVVKFGQEQTIHRAQRLFNESKFEQAAELYQNVINKKLEAFKRSKQAAQTPLDRFLATGDMSVLVEARAKAVIELYNVQLGRSNSYFDIEKGLQICLKASSSLGESHDLLTQLSLLRANALFKLGHYEKSLEIYLEVLKIRTDTYGPDHVHVAYVMVDLGEYYLVTASYIESETFLGTALTVITDAINLEPAEMQVTGTVHASVFIRCGLLLMGLWLRTGSYGNISNLLTQCTHICDKALGQSNPLYAQLMQVQCAVLVLQGKYSDAHKLALSILDIQQQLYGKENLEIAATLRLLASIDLTRGQNLVHARKCVESAKQMVVKIITPPATLSPSSSPSMSSVQVHHACAELDYLRGNIEYELGDAAAAEASLVDAFEQYKTLSLGTVSASHPGCLAVIRTLCKMHVSWGFLQATLPASLGVTDTEIVAIIEDIQQRQCDVIGNPLHLDVLLTADLRASAYALKGNISEASALVRSNIEKHEEIYRVFSSETKVVDTNIHVVGAKLQLAAMHRLVGRVNEAKELVSTCGIYISRVIGDSSLISASALYELACIATIRGKHKDAKFLLSRSVATNCRIRGGGMNDPFTVHALLAAAANIREVGYLDDALKAVMNAASIHSKLCKANGDSVTTCMINCLQAQLLCDYGTKEKVQQAEELLLSSLETLKTVLRNERNYWYLLTYSAYARCCFTAQKHDDATALYQKALTIHTSLLGENTATTAYFDLQSGMGLTMYHSVKYAIAQNQVIEFLQVSVLPVAEKVYGKNHPKTMHIHGCIALCRNELAAGSGDRVIDDLLLSLRQYNQIKFCAMHPWVVLYGGYHDIAVASPSESPVTTQQDPLTSWALPASVNDPQFMQAKIPADHVILTNTDSVESWGSIVHQSGPAESPAYSTPPKFSPLGSRDVYGGVEDVTPVVLDSHFAETPAAATRSASGSPNEAVKEVEKVEVVPAEPEQVDPVQKDEAPAEDPVVNEVMNQAPVDAQTAPVVSAKGEQAHAGDAEVNANAVQPDPAEDPASAVDSQPTADQVDAVVAVAETSQVDELVPATTEVLAKSTRSDADVAAGADTAPATVTAAPVVESNEERRLLGNDKVSRAINAAEFLFERASDLHNEGGKANFYQAQPLFNEACLVLALNQPQTERLALYLHTSGRNLHMFCCLEQAQERFKEAYEVCQGLSSDSGKGLLLAVTKSLIQGLTALGKPIEALNMCQTGLETAAKLYEQANPIVGLALLQCTDALLSLSSINEAKAQCDKGYAILNKAFGTRDVRIADAFYMRASVAKMQGKLKEAKPLAEQALAIRRNFLGDKHHDIADSILLMALCLLDMGKPEEAAVKLQQCIDMRNLFYGNLDDLRILEVSHYHAQVLCKTGKYRESLQLHNRILSLRQSMLSPTHISISDSLQGIADNLVVQGKYSEALQLLQQALDIRKRVYVARPNERVAQTLCSIARTTCLLGNLQESKEYVDASLNMRREIFTKNHWLYLQSQHEQVNLLMHQEQWAPAYTLCMRTLKARKELLGDDHPDYADSLVLQGICLCAERSDSSLIKAKEVVDEALAIRRMLFGDSVEVAECMNLLGVVFLCDYIPLTDEKFSLSDADADDDAANKKPVDLLAEEKGEEDIDALGEEEENQENEEASVRSADTLERTDDGVPVFNNTHFRSLIDRFNETQKFLESLSSATGGSDVLLTQVKANVGIVERLEYEAEKKFDASLGISDRKAYRDAKNLALVQKSSTESKSDEDVVKDFVVPGVTAIRDAVMVLTKVGLAEKHPLIVRLTKYSKTKEEKPSDLVVAKRALLKAEGYRKQHYQYFAASNSYDDAMASFIEAFGPVAANVNLDVATTIYGKAEVLSALGYYKRSNICLVQYISICQKASGDKSILTVKGNFCKAENTRKLGKLEESKALHESVLQLKIELFGKYHPDVAESYRAMAELHYEMGVYVEAKRLITKAFETLDLYSQSQSTPSADTLDPLQKAEFHHVLSKIHLATAKFKEAASVAADALTLLSTKFSSDDRHPLFSSFYLVQAACAMWRSEYAEAMKLANKALSIRVIYYNKVTNKRKFFNDKLAESKVDFLQALERLSKVAVTQYEEDKPLFAGMDIKSMKQSFSSKTSVKPFVFMGDVVASHPLVAEVVCFIGEVRLQQGKLLESSELFKFTKVMRDDVFDSDSLMNAPTMLGIAYTQRRLGELACAEATYQALLDVCMKSLSETHPLRADTMAEYGDLLFQLCKFSSCDTYFAEANKIYQLAYEDAHPKKGLLLLYSANVMQFHGHYAEANENYKRAADMMHQTTGDSSLFSAMVLLGQAKCAKDQGIYQLSVSLVDQAMSVVSSIFGEGHYLLYSCMCNLAEILRQQGKFLEARKTVMQCLVGQRDTLGGKHPETTASLLVFANINLDLANYQLSRLIFERLLSYTRRVYGENHTEVAMCVSGLAETACYEAKYKESINLHDAALLLRRKIYGDKHQFIAQSIYHRACLSLRLGRYDEAVQGFDDSLAMRRVLFGQVHRDIAQSLYGLASAFLVKGKLPEAKAMHERALSMRRTILGEHVEVYESQYANALLDQLYGKYEQALANIERCYEKQRIARGATHPIIASILTSMGSLSCILGRYAESRSYLFEALNMRKNIFEKDYINHPDIDESLFAIAEYLRVVGLYDVVSNEAVAAIDLQTVILPFEDAISKSVTRSEPVSFEVVMSSNKGEDEKLHTEVMEAVNNVLTYIIDEKELVSTKKKGKVVSDDASVSNTSTAYSTSSKKKAPAPAKQEAVEKEVVEKKDEYRSALSLYKRVLSRQLELYGSEHLYVLKTQSMLAETLRCLGNYNAAYEILEHVYITSKRVLGSEHYDSVEASCLFADMLRTVAKIYPHSESEEPRVTAVGGNRSLAPKLEEHVGSIMGFGPVSQLEPLTAPPTHMNESIKSNSFLFPSKSKKPTKIIPYQGGYQGYAYPASKKQAPLAIVASTTSSTHDCKAIYEEALICLLYTSPSPRDS